MTTMIPMIWSSLVELFLKVLAAETDDHIGCELSLWNGSEANLGPVMRLKCFLTWWACYMHTIILLPSIKMEMPKFIFELQFWTHATSQISSHQTYTMILTLTESQQ